MVPKLSNPLVAAGAVMAMALGISTPARAGMPVIDAANLAQAIAQVRSWGQQLQGMILQYNQLVFTYQSLTGPRGMQNLLPISLANRNYLPTNASDLANIINGTSVTYGGLSLQTQSLVQSNAVLSNAQVQALSPAAQQLLNAGRQNAATLGMLSQTTTSNASQNFANLQTLIATLGTTRDTKASADLAGRIQSEQVMTQNNQVKTDALYQTVSYQELAREQQVREQVVAFVGDWNTRVYIPPTF